MSKCYEQHYFNSIVLKFTGKTDLNKDGMIARDSTQSLAKIHIKVLNVSGTALHAGNIKADAYLQNLTLIDSRPESRYT